MLATTEVKMVMSGSEKKKREQEHIRRLLHKTRYYEVSKSFTL